MQRIISPYKNTELSTRVDLHPNQMNNEIYIFLKNNLKKTVEKKCNRYGYVSKIFQIKKYENAILEPENFSGSAVCDVIYDCRLCIPIEHTVIVAKIKAMNSLIILAENGPILIIVTINEINTDNFNKDSTGNIKHKTKKIVEGDYVIVTILKTQYNLNDQQIRTMCKLEDLATESEISFFEKELIDIHDEDEIDREINVDNQEVNKEYIESEIV